MYPAMISLDSAKGPSETPEAPTTFPVDLS
jgi:hypothetical protein